MSERRLLALIAFLLGLLGGLLILARGLDQLQRSFSPSQLSSLVDVLVVGILGIAILLGSLLIYRGQTGSGGILNILLGVVALILNTSTEGAILAIVSGVVGLVASEAGSKA